MIVKVGARDDGGGASRQDHLQDPSKSRGGPHAYHGDRVYRRRIRSLKDLPVEVIRPPNSSEEGGIGSLSTILTAKSGGQVPVVEGVKYRSGTRPKLLPSNNSHGPARLKPSRKEATSDAGQGRGRVLVEHLEAYGVMGQSKRVGKVVNGMSVPKRPCREAFKGRSDEDDNDKLTKGLNPATRVHRQSTLDQFLKTPQADGKDVELKKQVLHDIDVIGLSKHDGSPSGFKRKNMMGPDDFIEPLKGNVFPPIPSDDQFLRRKRQKIRNKEVLVAVFPADSMGNGSLGKKRASVTGHDQYEGQFSPGSTKRRRKQSIVPSTQVPVNKHHDYGPQVEIKRISVNRNEELLAKHLDKGQAPRLKKNGEPDGRFKSKGLGSLPVQVLTNPHSILIPLQEERVQDPGVSLNPAPDKKQSRIKKDGRPDGRFKNREYLGLGRKTKENAHPVSLRTVDKQSLTAVAGDVHAKKLPEVQKNGVRKPKRVQLKRLFVDKPIVQPPGVDNGAKSRVVKSLWSPPKQMKHIADVRLDEAVVPHRLVKSTKFLSLHQLDDPGKLNKVRARPTSPVVKDSDELSASDRTISDCSPDLKNQTLQSSIGITSEHSKPWKIHARQEEVVSLPLKARLREKGQEIKKKNASNKRTIAKHTVETTCRDLKGATESHDLSPKTRTKKSTVRLVREMPHGDLEGTSKLSDIALRTREQPSTAQQMGEMTNGVLGVVDDSDLSPSTRMHSTLGEQTQEVPSGDFEGTHCVPRMTPRTRKLTDAMQNFLHQKATLLRQWKEMELGKLHPMALIGRSCKIFWPLDSEWYPGVIHEYNPQTRRHRIDYEDEEREWVALGKERVKLHVSAEESKVLEMSFGEGSLMESRQKLDPDELAVLAAGIEGSQGELGHGELVWAKVKGYPLWPAFVMDEEHASVSGLEPAPRERTIPVQFFGSYDHARINTKKAVQFSKGIVQKYHTKCKRTVFEQGLQEVERYLKECKLPEQMAQLQEEVVAVVNKRASDSTSTDETDEEEQDFVKDEGNNVAKTSAESVCTFPLELGALRILALGKIVTDSEQFHTENYIWTEGYTAIHKFSSMKDPEKVIEYKMEVLRNSMMPSLPLFRVTPEDDKAVEASTASGCWKRILIKVQRAKEKAGLCIATLLEKKRQSFRSGPSMFGFGNRKVAKLIQALPNARVCSKFTAWIEKPPPEEGSEELAPAGYQAVEHNWKHLDRCNVCYLDEEYADNQLLQCDKCRTMVCPACSFAGHLYSAFRNPLRVCSCVNGTQQVHMSCYGELEPPDGDLWLCNLCRPGAPKRSPICCLCPVAGGAMKTTTDGRWAHLTCAMWTPETCLVDIKRMEPVDGISSINKERWKLICTVCKVPYGACIQCSKPHCRIAFHPLCARAEEFPNEVLEDKVSSIKDCEGGVQLLTYCKRHKIPTVQGGHVRQQSQQKVTASRNCSTFSPPSNPSGCARGEPYSAASRRGHRQPEALAAALAKRFFVENRPYLVTGCQRNVPKKELKSTGVSLWSWHWKQPRSSIAANGDSRPNECEVDGEKTPQSTSERYRHMRSTLHERLTFGKSAIHGWGVFTKRPHRVGDMVIEYAGEIVRPIIADIRERRSYDSLVGAGTYMFRIDDERVVDATHAGSIAHLINHSCEPNCYSRVVAASGDDHIVIFAKRDIPEGEELTYDYRFASKDELLTCYCGCTGCRGFVNTCDSDEEPSKVTASRSELTKWIVQ